MNKGNQKGCVIEIVTGLFVGRRNYKERTDFLLENKREAKGEPVQNQKANEKGRDRSRKGLLYLLLFC